MPKRLTQEEVIQRMNKINPNIKIVGEYINNSTKLQCECLVCQHIWYAKPHNLFYGKGCPKCASTKYKEMSRKSHERFIFEMAQVNPNIKIIDKYINNTTKIRFYCKVCGFIHEATPRALLQGQGCPKCAITHRAKLKRKSHKQFIDEMQKINPNIIILGNYINASTKIQCKCLICGCEWYARPNSLLKNHGCPQCNISRGEKCISDFLSSKNINYISQYKFDDCKIVNILSFDFYLPDYNACIEYDGKQHYQPVQFGNMSLQEAEEKFPIQQYHDKVKTEYCLSNKIKLIRIPYWEFNNIKEILNKELF